MKLMNFRNKVLLLTALLSVSNAHCGPGMLSKISTPIMRAGYSATLHSSRRYCSGVKSKSQYVFIDSDGVITIKQEKYPKISAKQNVVVRPRIVSELMFTEHSGMPYHFVKFDNLKDQVEVTNTERIVNESSGFNIISSDQVQDKPYSSVGRLEMFFTKDGELMRGYGSGAAIDKNLIITAAHNIYDEHHGKAQTVYFQHMLTDTETLGNSKRAAQFFVHPQWADNFEKKYDIALVFLSESLNLTAAQIENLLKLQILQGIGNTLSIVGYPNGVINMSESSGKEVNDEKGDSEHMIYHLANTERGNSGSPIISKDLHIVGTHTNGFGSDCIVQANNGVKVRPDIFKFVKDSVKSYQESLNDNKAKDVQKEEQQAIIDKEIAKVEKIAKKN